MGFQSVDWDLDQTLAGNWDLVPPLSYTFYGKKYFVACVPVCYLFTAAHF